MAASTNAIGHQINARETEQPLFQNRLALVPQRNTEAQVLLAIAEAGDGVLAPR